MTTPEEWCECGHPSNDHRGPDGRCIECWLTPGAYECRKYVPAAGQKEEK